MPPATSDPRDRRKASRKAPLIFTLGKIGYIRIVVSTRAKPSFGTEAGKMQSVLFKPVHP